MKTLYRWLCAAAVFLALAATAAAQGSLTQKELTASGSDCSVATRCAMYDMTNIASLGIDLDVASTATVQFEVSQDSTNGVNGRWGSTTDTGGNTNATADGRHYFVNLGYRWIRFRASALGSTAMIRPARGYGAGAASGTGGAGDASAANQTTMIGHIDELETLLTDIETAVELLDNAISGAGFNVTQLGGAAIPMITTQADNQAATTDALAVASFLYMYDGTNLDLVRGDTTNGLDVDVTRMAALVAGDADIGNVDLELAGTAISHTNRLPVCISDGVSACVEAVTDPQEDATVTDQQRGPAILGARRDTPASSAGSNGEYALFNTDANGLLWTRSYDPCSALPKSRFNFSISSATTTEIIDATGASNKGYICSMNIVVGGANNVALVADDTDGCASPGTGGEGLAGGTSAATGWNFGANGGLVTVGGNGTGIQTSLTNVNICLITSGTAQTSGSGTYVTAP